MNYLDLLEIKKYLSLLKREESGSFPSVQFNNFEIELWAGPGAFCSPMMDYSNLMYYESIQVGVYEMIKEQKCAIAPSGDARFHHFDWIKHFHYFDGKGVQKDSYMGTRIPLNEVCHLIREVYKVSRLKMFY